MKNNGKKRKDTSGLTFRDAIRIINRELKRIKTDEEIELVEDLISSLDQKMIRFYNRKKQQMEETIRSRYNAEA